MLKVREMLFISEICISAIQYLYILGEVMHDNNLLQQIIKFWFLSFSVLNIYPLSN